MSYLGTLHEKNKVRFERLLPAPIELVWQYLTEPKFLATWIAEADVELRVGGRIELRFDEESDPDDVCKGATVSGGIITVCEPPRRLTFAFSDAPAGKTILTYQLEDSDGQVLLVLSFLES